jgi:hypothetical protein
MDLKINSRLNSISWVGANPFGGHQNGVITTISIKS